MEKIKKEYGITLVALVITIIILLILAGVAINALTQTGLFENAKQAKNITENAQKDENKKLGEYSSKINEYISGTSRDEASSEVLKKIEETSTVNTYSYTGSEQEYTVPEDGYYKIECWGAQGGTYQYAVGGKGAYTKGIIKLSKGEKLYVYVGECYNGARETMCYNGGGSGLSGKAIISSASGGSSYISGYDGCNSIAESSTEKNIIHTGNIIHYSGKYFLYTRMESGRNYMPSPSDTTTEVQGNSGNGYAKITKMKVENF